MKIAIIKYNAGNVQSVLFALKRLNVEPVLTDEPEIIQQADKVIFPGVGEASSTMKYLKERELDTLICRLKQPVLGICLGMQLLCEYSREGDTKCLGVFPQNVLRFIPPKGEKYKIPQIGWNNLYNTRGKLFENTGENPFMYFVHSYYVDTGEYTAAMADYILPFSAALQKDNFYATQFHPEKSSRVGERLLKNFISI